MASVQESIEYEVPVRTAYDRKVKGDLQRFKEFVEARGAETGARRGEVDQDPTS